MITSAILHESEDSSMQSFIDISVITYQNTTNVKAVVNILYLAIDYAVISLKTILREAQPVPRFSPLSLCSFTSWEICPKSSILSVTSVICSRRWIANGLAAF